MKILELGLDGIERVVKKYASISACDSADVSRYTKK